MVGNVLRVKNNYLRLIMIFFFFNLKYLYIFVEQLQIGLHYSYLFMNIYIFFFVFTVLALTFIPNKLIHKYLSIFPNTYYIFMIHMYIKKQYFDGHIQL